MREAKGSEGKERARREKRARGKMEHGERGRERSKRERGDRGSKGKGSERGERDEGRGKKRTIDVRQGKKEWRVKAGEKEAEGARGKFVKERKGGETYLLIYCKGAPRGS